MRAESTACVSAPANEGVRRPPLVWPECRTDASIGPGGWDAWLGVHMEPHPLLTNWARAVIEGLRGK